MKDDVPQPTWTDDPIIGIPIDDIIAWVDAWETHNEPPMPIARRVG